MIRILLSLSLLSVMLPCGTMAQDSDAMEVKRRNIENMPAMYPEPMTAAGAPEEEIGKFPNRDNEPCMCTKDTMAADGIVRLSKIEVYPEYLEEYVEYATEVGEISLRTEPGVLTMYAVSEKANPCKITILETYASMEAYKKHVASEHFQKYKRQTLHMVKSLELSDQTPLNPSSRIDNYISISKS